MPSLFKLKSSSIYFSLIFTLSANFAEYYRESKGTIKSIGNFFSISLVIICTSFFKVWHLLVNSSISSFLASADRSTPVTTRLGSLTSTTNGSSSKWRALYSRSLFRYELKWYLNFMWSIGILKEKSAPSYLPVPSAFSFLVSAPKSSVLRLTSKSNSEVSPS